MTALNADWLAQAQQTSMAKSPAWLAAIRKQALDQFLATGLPDRHLEAWKYTRINFLEKNPLQLTTPYPDLEEIAQLPQLHADSQNLCAVFVDGFFAPILSRLEGLPDSVRFFPLARHLTQSSTELTDLNQELDDNEQPFWWLNQALMQDGVVLNIKAGAEVETPLTLFFISTTNSQNLSQQNRHQLVLGERAKANIIVRHMAMAPCNSFISHATTVSVGDGATLNLTKINQESDDSTHLSNTKIAQGAASHVAVQLINLGGQLTRDRIDVVQAHPEAHLSLRGLCLPNNHQHMNVHINLNHQAAHGHSDVLVKSVLADRAVTVFNGKIYVAQGAEQVSAHLKNNNLLLSKTAEANSKPVLEIYHDAVQCSHGATCGSLDLEALFYCQSRGIARALAQRLLTLAFVEDVLQALTQVSDMIKTSVTEKLMRDLEVMV